MPSLPPPKTTMRSLMATALCPCLGLGEGPVALPTFFHLRMGDAIAWSIFWFSVCLMLSLFLVNYASSSVFSFDGSEFSRLASDWSKKDNFALIGRSLLIGPFSQNIGFLVSRERLCCQIQIAWKRATRKISSILIETVLQIHNFSNILTIF